MLAIETRGLTRLYGKLAAVQDLNLSVPQGSLFGLIGPNGAGKTTTLRMLAGLLQPSSGEIIINGKPINQNLYELRTQIGYMPDFFGVYEDLVVWEYLDFFARCYNLPSNRRKQVIDELLELVDLSEKREAYVHTLSRGMRQRLCLAHALVHDPQVLLLDEPASGLDPRARVEMRELLRELGAMGKTVVLSSHILSELAELCELDWDHRTRTAGRRRETGGCTRPDPGWSKAAYPHPVRYLPDHRAAPKPAGCWADLPGQWRE